MAGRTLWRHVCGSFALAAVAMPALVNCGSIKPPIDLPAVPGACTLDVTKPEAIANFDFQKEFSIQADAAGKLKAGTIAAVELKAFADAIDADLKVACGGLNKDLGGKGEEATGKEACDASLKLLDEWHAKLGANAKIAIAVDPPKCGVEIKAYADCAGKCDAKLSGGSAKVECEGGKLQGTCNAKCAGTCEMSGAAKCDGKCNGSCDATFSGTCGGKCDGKCDGKALPATANGKCAGKCDGKCDAQAAGTCGGQCSGSCDIKAEGECKGTCSGKCSAEMEAPKCTGEVKPPEMSAECKAQCDASVNAKASCTPAHIAVTVTGATDMKLVEQFKAAIEKNLGPIVKVAVGMGERTIKMADNIKVVIEGVQGSIEGIASGGSGGAGGAAMTVGKITACVGGPFKGAIDAAASLKANVNVSVQVNAKASASGGAKAKGGT